MKLNPLFLGILVTGCSSVTAPRLGDEFRLRFGESLAIAGTPVTVGFSDVTEDSRCPARVQCVWVGDGAVELQVADGSRTQVVILHTNPEFATTVALANLILELVALDPYPETPDQIALDDYEVTLVVTAAQQ